jgi:class 3 adenylate cyclase/Ca2+-binding EF-hand superfamily protein
MEHNAFSEESKPLGRRALAAIMFTDVVDSSRLMGDNEEHMMALLNRDLRVISELCRQFEGRVLKSMGDGCLAIFDSGVHAVECAQEIQRHFAEQARALPKNEVLQHRIGVHLGDVYVTEDDTMGDGVNVAARLQSEAPPGGICISQALYEVVKTRISLQTVYQGPKQLKNIREKIHLYQLVVSGETEQEPSAPPQVSPERDRGGHKKLLWIAGLLVVLVVGFLIFQITRRSPDIPSDLSPKFHQLDRNNDQRLTSEELPEQVRDRVMQADKNHDGAVDVPEFQEAFKQQQKWQEFQTVLFRQFDRNDDQKLAPDELSERVRDRIMRADKNNDGAVDVSEFQEALNQRRNLEVFQTFLFRQFDRNDDQKLSPDEIPESFHDRIMRMDQNQDGAVSVSEFQETLK